jgi:uncharacterized coiled-coil protein SlyX
MKLMNVFKKKITKETEKIAELEVTIAKQSEMLNEYDEMVQKMLLTNEGLTDGIGLLQQRYNESNRNGIVTIASLLTASGGSVFLSKDIIDAVDESNIKIDYSSAEDGSGTTVILVQCDSSDDEVDDDEFDDEGSCPDCGGYCGNDAERCEDE